MNRQDYTKGHEVMELLKSAGRIIDSMDAPLSDRQELLNPISNALSTINVWLAKGRAEAEAEVYKPLSTFKETIGFLKNLFR